MSPRIFFTLIVFVIACFVDASSVSLNDLEDQELSLDGDDSRSSNDDASDKGSLSDTDLSDLDVVDDNDDNVYVEKHETLSKENFIYKYMLAATRAPEVSSQLGQVLPILRSMSPPQRLALATLLTLQMMSSTRSSLASLDQVTAMFGIHPNEAEDKKKNMSSELLLPISLDIANIFRGAVSARSVDASPQAMGLRSMKISPGTRRKTFLMPHVVAKGNRHRPVISSGHNRRNVHVQTEMIPPPPPPARSPGAGHHVKGRRPSVPSAFSAHHQVPKREPSASSLKDIANQKKRGDFEPPDAECEYFTNTLCLEVSNYPNDAIIASIKRSRGTIEALLADFKQLAAEFPNESEIIHQKEKYSIENNFNIRRQDQNIILEGGLCPSSVKFARPKRARTTTGLWKYIVNTGDYTQTLRLEMCLYPQEQCSYVSEQFRSECTQVYNYHRLLTWDDVKGLHMDIFKVPTCCSCHVNGYSVPFPPRDTEPARDPNQHGGNLPGTDFATDDHRRPFPGEENRVNQHTFEGTDFRHQQQPTHNNEPVNVDIQRTPFQDNSNLGQFTNGQTFHVPFQHDDTRNRIPDQESVNIFVTPGTRQHEEHDFRNHIPDQQVHGFTGQIPGPPPAGFGTRFPEQENGLRNQFPTQQNDPNFRNQFQDNRDDQRFINQFNDPAFGHFERDVHQRIHITTSAPVNDPPFHRQGFRRPTSDDLVPPAGPPLPLAHESNVQTFAGNQIRRSRNQTSSNIADDSDLDVGESTVNRRPFPNTISSDSIRRGVDASTEIPVSTTKVPNTATKTTTSATAGKKVNYSYHPIIDYFKPQSRDVARSRQDWTPILTVKKSHSEKSVK